MTREELSQDMQDEIFKEENRLKRKRIIITTIKWVFILVILFILFFLYTRFVSTTGFVIKEERIINKKLPSEYNGLKIVQFSDLHYGSSIHIKELKKIVKMINSTEPDIVVFTGDLIDTNHKLNNKEREKIINELGSIDSSIGNYAVLGDEDSDEFMTIFNQGGFVILNNTYDLVYFDNNNPILLSGVSYSVDPSVYYKAYDYYNDPNHNSNIYNITLIHQPDTINDLKDRFHSDLYLAGHSHNGYIRVPFLGSFINKKGAKKYHNEYYDLDGTPLYISSGLGTNNSIGFRLFCRPSISLYRLSNK